MRAILWHDGRTHRRRRAQDDILVKIVDGVHADWSAADRSSELHVFARGGHGFVMVRQGLPSDGWTDLFLAWLDDLGIWAPHHRQRTTVRAGLPRAAAAGMPRGRL